jgi:hypothetical protein
MKSELRRYSMEIEDVPYAQVPQPYIKEYEDKSGEWVYADVALPTIEELEERNEKMLDVLKKLLHVANNAVPMNFMKELDEVVGHCKQVVNEIERDGR